MPSLKGDTIDTRVLAAEAAKLLSNQRPHRTRNVRINNAGAAGALKRAQGIPRMGDDARLFLAGMMLGVSLSRGEATMEQIYRAVREASFNANQ